MGTVPDHAGGAPGSARGRVRDHAVDAAPPGVRGGAAGSGAAGPDGGRARREIDFPFEARFGASSTGSQWQALRARTFDREVRRFLHDHPDGTVIALGEGLETQLWRVNNNHVRWVSVDLPPVIQLRRQLLPASPRLELVASSVVDGAWLDEIDRTRGTLVTAQGLLMYLEPEQVHELIAACAARIAAAAACSSTRCRAGSASARSASRWGSRTATGRRRGRGASTQPRSTGSARRRASRAAARSGSRADAAPCSALRCRSSTGFPV